MELIPIALVLGVGYMMTQTPDSYNALVHQPDSQKQKDTTMYNLSEMGIQYNAIKPQALNATNLNNAYLPFSAPFQGSTRSMPSVYQSLSDNIGIVQAYGNAFYINTMGEIPLISAQQANPNVEIPTVNSFPGDPNASLVNFPRVMVDAKGPMAQYAYPFTSAQVAVASGEPTESEVIQVPATGKLNREYNPWGPGGAVQNLYGIIESNRTRRFGTDLSNVITPPRTLNTHRLAYGRSAKNF